MNCFKGRLLNRKTFSFFSIVNILVFLGSCDRGPEGNSAVNENTTGEAWFTTANQSMLLKKQDSALLFNSPQNNLPYIDIDSGTALQSIDGFGYTLTAGSAIMINKMNEAEKSALLEELFGKGENSIRISYLRVSIGASDLNPFVFSYDDMPPGQTDTALAHFSLSHDTVDVLPVLKRILAINPGIKIMGSPWSPPAWMKDNKNSKGGSLLPEYYGVYARYFVKYINEMKSRGINIDAITPQNEPQHGGNNPSMVMSAEQQAAFIKNHLGPAFRSAGILTKIIVWDHNCDRPDYPITILNDARAKQYVDGSAFHLYNGDVSALSQVHNAHPDKNLYFTEQWTGSRSDFDGDLKWHIKNVIIGTLRNWSKIALEWNLANDSTYNPHTPGGCTECKGALTITGSTVKRNVAYYIIAHASKFITPGSVRLNSNIPGSVHNVAAKTPEGKIVLIALNEGNSPVSFNIRFKGKWASTALPAGTVATYSW